ncbi:MAG: hypothetical protein ACQEQG_10735 [Bacillota bacterium]
MLSSRKIYKAGYLSVAVILLGILLVGCSQGGSYKIIMGDIHAGENSIKGSYSTFSGNYYKKVEMDKNSRIMLKLTTDTEAGSLSAQLIDPEGNIILELEAGSQKETTINEVGKYEMKVIGDDHKGNFKFEWVKKLLQF